MSDDALANLNLAVAELLDRMALANAIRAIRGRDVTASECEQVFARYAALRVTEGERDASPVTELH